MSYLRSGPIALMGVATFFAISACSDGIAPDRLAPEGASAASTTSGYTLVECPVEEEKTAAETLTAQGGVLRLDGHELRLPLGAITAPRKFEMAAPVSNYMEIRIRAGNQDSFKFDRPATITIDYSRCTRSNIDKDPLSVWKIDPVTKELLQYVGGVDDKVARTVTFQTDGLSNWSIAR
jgi:hypothetical protein